MNYQESIAYLKSLSPTLEKPGLARMRAFLELNFDLTGLFPVLHVGGTNGKGSVTTILQGLLSGFNLPVGKFTGPHLLAFNERFVVGKEAIDDDELAPLISKVRLLSEDFAHDRPELGPLTWFEVLTACAAFYFQAQKVDCAVLEVGLGGRFDATNAFENILCSVITNVDLDHCHLLGATREAIAREKAGILRVGRPVITACEDDRAFAVIASRARELACPVVRLLAARELRENSCFGLELAYYGFDDIELEGIDAYVRFLEEWVLEDWSSQKNLGLAGAYQRRNVALALIALYFSERLPWPCAEGEAYLADKLLNSLRHISWPGRFQRLKLQLGVQGPLALILDGAHNCHGVRALRQSLPATGRQIFIFACYANKEPADMLAALLGPGDILFTCPLEGERQAAEPATIVALARELGNQAKSFETLEAALVEAQGLLSSSANFLPEVVICGSFALVRQVLSSPFLVTQS